MKGVIKMAYVRPNFKSKAELIRAITVGQRVQVWQMNNLFNRVFEAGEWITLEGPHYPQPHKWYAEAKLGDDLCIDKVK